MTNRQTFKILKKRNQKISHKKIELFQKKRKKKNFYSLNSITIQTKKTNEKYPFEKLILMWWPLTKKKKKKKGYSREKSKKK